VAWRNLNRIGWYFPTSHTTNIRKSRPQIGSEEFSDFWNGAQRIIFPNIGKILGNPAHSISHFTSWAKETQSASDLYLSEK
jgi:hypothetical protein